MQKPVYLPVRAFFGVVAFAGGGAVAFPDASGVEVCGVAVDAVVGEEGIKDGETSLDEPGGLPVVGKVDAVEEVGTVAGVGHDWLRESSLCEPCSHGLGTFEGGGMLCIGCGDAAGPDGVEVDGEPAAADDVGISGGGVAPGEALFDAVGPAGQESGIHFVEADVDACDITECVQCSRLPGKGIKVVEVAAVDAAVAEGPEFDDVTVGKEEGEGFLDFVFRLTSIPTPTLILIPILTLTPILTPASADVPGGAVGFSLHAAHLAGNGQRQRSGNGW
ncbi:hypothetical protein MKMG_01794 [Methanogenium sp. MK-MG]|nr:hypothetical protein MKMG_01794 [Methanogenium sp. MK-MG]